MFTHRFNLWSASKILGSLTTNSLANVETRPTLLVASHMYRPESPSRSSCMVSVQRCDPSKWATNRGSFSSKPSLYQSTCGTGSPRTCNIIWYNWSTPASRAMLGDVRRRGIQCLGRAARNAGWLGNRRAANWTVKVWRRLQLTSYNFCHPAHYVDYKDDNRRNCNRTCCFIDWGNWFFILRT